MGYGYGYGYANGYANGYGSILSIHGKFISLHLAFGNALESMLKCFRTTGISKHLAEATALWEMGHYCSELSRAHGDAESGRGSHGVTWKLIITWVSRGHPWTCQDYWDLLCRDGQLPNRKDQTL